MKYDQNYVTKTSPSKQGTQRPDVRLDSRYSTTRIALSSSSSKDKVNLSKYLGVYGEKIISVKRLTKHCK